MPERKNIIRIFKDVSEEQYFVITGFYRRIAGFARIKSDYPHLVRAGFFPIFFDELGRFFHEFRVRNGNSEVDCLVLIPRFEIGEHLFCEFRIVSRRSEAERIRFSGGPIERFPDNLILIDGIGERETDIFSLRSGLLFWLKKRA